MTFATVVMMDLVGIKKLPQLMALTFPLIGALQLIVISTSGRSKLLILFYSIEFGKFKHVPLQLGSWNIFFRMNTIVLNIISIVNLLTE